ncbi:MAG: metallophosphoesterase family protein, partial [Minisyncoccia bacterium]
DVLSIETLKIIIENFNQKIFLSLGNGDDEKLFNKFLKENNNQKLSIFDEFGKIVLNNLKIGLTHFPDIAKKLVENNNFDFVFYGHTHRPWEEKINQTIILNPGNLAGIFYKPTFAILDTKNLKRELIIL